jgi:hypothetical protein
VFLHSRATILNQNARQGKIGISRRIVKAKAAARRTNIELVINNRWALPYRVG